MAISSQQGLAVAKERVERQKNELLFERDDTAVQCIFTG